MIYGMTDAELIAGLRNLAAVLGKEAFTYAADRIEALLAEREKDHANINLKADFIEKTLNQLAETEAKLAKAVEALEFVDGDFEVVLKVRATLAEIKGETYDRPTTEK